MALITPPLSVSGANILDGHGNPCSLGLGVNWGGAQQDELLPYGLNRLHRSAIIGRIKGWGMSHVRFPFALGSFVNNNGTLKTGLAKASRLTANPDLQGLTPWGVYQQLADDMTAAGLYVILNQHLLHEGWCCATADNNGLWYNDNWPSSTFSHTWFMIAERFKDNPLIGYDLHNEPRPATVSGRTVTPTWGDGVWASDFRRSYQWHADQIHLRNPGALIFCEGLGYAADLTGAGGQPVTGPGIVYSVHDYSWFHNGQDRAAYYAANDRNWGYLTAQAPVWVGEFGLNTDMPAAAISTGWLPDFLAYCADRKPCGTCWWELSATAVLGTQPVTGKVITQAGQREDFGLMSGQDWLGSQADVLAMLAPLTA